MELDIPLREPNTDQNTISCLGAKTLTIINHSTKNIKSTAFFKHNTK